MNTPILDGQLQHVKEVRERLWKAPLYPPSVFVNAHTEQPIPRSEANNKLRARIEEARQLALSLGEQEAEKLGWCFLEVDEVVLRHPMTSKYRAGLILKAIARIYSKANIHQPITVNDIISERREQWILPARFHASYRIREKLPLSLPKIGKIMGGRDHTTILYHIERHKQRMGIT